MQWTEPAGKFECRRGAGSATDRPAFAAAEGMPYHHLGCHEVHCWIHAAGSRPGDKRPDRLVSPSADTARHIIQRVWPNVDFWPGPSGSSARVETSAEAAAINDVLGESFIGFDPKRHRWLFHVHLVDRSDMSVVQPHTKPKLTCPRCGKLVLGGIMICPEVMIDGKSAPDPDGASITLGRCNCVAEKSHPDWRQFAQIVKKWFEVD